MSSRDVGRDMNFLHGPGESDDNNGEGKGVTSDIALNMGDEITELAAELTLLGTKVFLVLGMHALGMLLALLNLRGEAGLRCNPEIAVKFEPGATSVCMRSSVPGESGRKCFEVSRG